MLASGSFRVPPARNLSLPPPADRATPNRGVRPKSRTVWLAILLCGWAPSIAESAENPAAEFLAGAATADLTPPAGVSLDGPISKPGPARGVHDRLTARAIVMQQGQTTVALVINDMCMIDREVYDAAKQQVTNATGIPISHQLMAATHSHATPRVVRISTREPDEAYRSFVARRIAQAVIAAHRNLTPAVIGHGSFRREGLMACRRSLCRPGSVGVNPFGEAGERIKSVAGSSSAVIGPAGPVDPEFSFLSIRTRDGQPLALLGNLSVHYCGGYAGGLVSSDYFGAYSRHLEQKLNPSAGDHGFVGLMSNATSGDIGAFQRTGPRPGPWEQMQQVGQELADQTLEHLSNVEHTAPDVLAVETSELELSVRKPTAERVKWARELMNDPQAKGPHRWSRIYAQETLHLAEYPARYAIPLQAIRIGQIGIAAAPCEVFAETGLAIKAGSPLSKTFTIELANGYGGYLPTPQQHAWGGYETWPARSSHLEVQAEPRIRQELLRLLRATATASQTPSSPSDRQ